MSSIKTNFGIFRKEYPKTDKPAKWPFTDIYRINQFSPSFKLSEGGGLP